MTLPRLTPVNRWLEPLLALAVAAALVRCMLFLWTYGYLPHPFFYVASDSWMDWFNTAYWAHQGGAYDAWRTVYAPLSFVALRLLGDPACYAGAEGLTSRDCDWQGIFWLHFFFLLNAFLIARTYLRIDRSTALPRSFALAAGLPMLYGLERGNLIILCFTCVLLAYGPLLRSARLRWLAAGLAANFKIYAVALIFAHLLRRRWRWFEGAAIATLCVYVVTYAWLGTGSPLQIRENILSFGSEFEAIDFLDQWYATTYRALMSLFEGANLPISSLISSSTIDFWATALTLAQRFTQGLAVLAAAAAWLRPEVVPMHRLLGLAIGLTLVSIESFGYPQALLTLFVFMERWRGFGVKWAIVTCYVLAIPMDIVVHALPATHFESIYSGGAVTVENVLTVGPFLRPALLMSILVALSCATLRTVWLDVAAQGWKQRWRYRGDAPLLVGEGEARPPVRAGARAPEL